MKASRPLFSPRAMASHTSESMTRVTVGSIVRPCITRQVPSCRTTVHCPGSRPDRSNRITERILNVLRPYASNWSGTLGRGDLVIPQREIPRVIHEILDALHEDAATRKEAGDRELFDVLMAARRSASVQDQADLLRRHFIILLR